MGIIFNRFKGAPALGNVSPVSGSQMDPLLIQPAQPTVSQLSPDYLAASTPASQPVGGGVTLPTATPNDTPNLSPLGGPLDVANNKPNKI